MMQVITIVGNIVDDAELRKSKDGNSQFISFRVAVTENRGDDRKTTYYDVTHPSTGVLHFLKKTEIFPDRNLSPISQPENGGNFAAWVRMYLLRSVLWHDRYRRNTVYRKSWDT